MGKYSVIYIFIILSLLVSCGSPKQRGPRWVPKYQYSGAAMGCSKASFVNMNVCGNCSRAGSCSLDLPGACAVDILHTEVNGGSESVIAEELDIMGPYTMKENVLRSDRVTIFGAGSPEEIVTCEIL